MIFASLFGVGLSFTKVSRLEDAGASKMGYAGLYMLLASVGARADLKLIMDAPVFVAIGIGLVVSGIPVFVSSIEKRLSVVERLKKGQ